MDKIEYTRELLRKESILWSYIRPIAVYKDMVPSTFHRKIQGEITLNEIECDFFLNNLKEAMEFLSDKLNYHYEWL